MIGSPDHGGWVRGHAFVQNLRRGHYEPASTPEPDRLRVAAFDELAEAI